MNDYPRKKCLYVATFDPTLSSDGTTTRGRLFLRYIARHFETHLVHLQVKHGDGRDLSLLQSLASTLAIPYRTWDYYVFSKNFFQAIIQAQIEHQCDFIFADFEKSGLYAYLLSRKFHIPYVYNTHNVEFKRYISVARTNALRYAFVPYIWFVERLGCRNATITIAISEKDAATFRRWIPESRLMVLPCAFDERQITPYYDAILHKPPIVLMVGNYNNSGNRDGAYITYRKIIPQVVKQRPDTIFRFVGQDFPDDIRHQNIQVAGFVEDLMSEYARAAIVIAPIEIGGGVKIKVIEALASGKFLITTEKGMEGIDSANLHNMIIARTEDFSEHIVAVLDKSPEKSDANWTFVSSHFGIERSLKRLLLRINTLLI